MGENKVSKKMGMKKDKNNNNEHSVKKEEDTKKEINTNKPTKTINYNSHLLSEAIFLTTSGGSLIPATPVTLPPLVPSTSQHYQTTSLVTTTTTSIIDNSNKQVKEEKNETPTEGTNSLCAAASSTNVKKPSADGIVTSRSSANSSSSKTSSFSTQHPLVVTTATGGTLTTTNKEEEVVDVSAVSQGNSIFTTNFPFIATGIAPSNFVTGFTGSPSTFTAGLTPITTFSLQNPLLATSLTIPIYNSLVAVSGNAKDVILPTLNKDIFIPGVTTTKASKESTNKIKATYSVITHNGTTMTTSRGRKRTAQSRLPAKLKEPAAVARRNARERRRVKMVNDGFLRLRRHVPTDPKNKKLSKVKTLRLAIEYIHHLQQLLQADAAKQNGQIVSSFTHVSTYEDVEGGTTWLHSDSLARMNREMDEDIFHTIDPARLRTNYTEYVSR